MLYGKHIKICVNHVDQVLQIVVVLLKLFILQYGYINIVELLLKTPGIEVFTADNQGLTPLHGAARVSNQTFILFNKFYQSVRHVFIEYRKREGTTDKEYKDTEVTQPA